MAYKEPRNRARNVTTAQRTATTWGDGVLLWDTDLDAFYTGDGSTAGGVGNGAGDLVGPASAVDLVIATFDGTTGKLLRATGNKAMGGTRITGLGGGTASTDACQRGQLERGAGIGTVTTVTNAASPYTLLSTDMIIYCDTSGGSVTLNLPASAAASGATLARVFTIVRSGANTVVLDGSGAETVGANQGGGATFTLTTDGDTARILNVDVAGDEWVLI